MIPNWRVSGLKVGVDGGREEGGGGMAEKISQGEQALRKGDYKATIY